MKKLILISVLFFAFTSAAATETREDSIRQARVWLAPKWISNDFKFNSDLDVYAGPEVHPDDELLLEDEVSCRVNERTLEKEVGGQTMKFYCELPREKKSIVKVKYKFEDGEISGELLGTRLLWALGFAADRMFLINDLLCHGCTEDPYKDRRIDETTLKTPRPFYLAATERKFEGKEIKNGDDEGWSYQELMTLLPKANKDEALVHRDALRLLTVFLRHADNKAENQSLICLGKKNDEGGCSGETVLMIHDLGLTFGSGFETGVSKANFEDWDKAKIWDDADTCTAFLGDNAEEEMKKPVISEEGRVFLAKLLRGFVSGEAGRKRVEDLFRSGRADYRFGTIEQWRETFLRKVDEIEFPRGRAHKNFKCAGKEV